MEQTKLAVRTAFILILALTAGSFVSVEQPGSSVMFELYIFKVLLALGCVITKFPFCSYGSGFNKPSKWLYNKPWLLSLESRCNCAYKKHHVVIEGSFTRAGIAEFDRRCRPDCQTVYGKVPRVGEALSAFSAAYPLPLCKQMAKGSLAAHQRFASDKSLQGRKVRLLRRPSLITQFQIGVCYVHGLRTLTGLLICVRHCSTKSCSGTASRKGATSTSWNAEFTSHG